HEGRTYATIRRLQLSVGNGVWNGCAPTLRGDWGVRPTRPADRDNVTTFLAVVCGLFGLAVGSFLNVVIHRVPRRESVSHPRSRCPGCGTQLAARDNVPVLSWVLLRRRCRSCGEPISVRYPLVELATAALFVSAGLRFGAAW